jgi:hypothetical protein
MTVMTRTEAVTIQVPAEYSYLRVLRLTVSSLAADIAFDIEEIEGARAAVDELASLLIGATDVHESVSVVIRRLDSRLVVEGRAPSVREVAEPDDLVRSVLDASTTTWACATVDEQARFEFSCVRGEIGQTASSA